MAGGCGRVRGVKRRRGLGKFREANKKQEEKRGGSPSLETGRDGSGGRLEEVTMEGGRGGGGKNIEQGCQRSNQKLSRKTKKETEGGGKEKSIFTKLRLRLK